MVSDRVKGDILILRGLGYTQAEVSQKLGVSQGAVAYHLRQFNKKAQEEGDYETATDVLSDAYLKDVIGFLQDLSKLRR